MHHRAAASLLFLLLATTTHGQVTVQDGQVELVSTADRSSMRVMLEGLPASRDLRVVQLASGSWMQNTKQLAPVAGGAFTSNHLVAKRFTLANDARVVTSHFRAYAANGSPVSIRISDQWRRTYCSAQGSGGAGATCTVDLAHRDYLPLRGDTAVDLLVEAEQRGSVGTNVTIEGFFQEAMPNPDPTEFQVDPVVLANGTAFVRVPLNLRTYAPGKSRGELFEVRDGDRPLKRFTAKTSWNGSTPAASLAVFDDGPSYSSLADVRASSSHLGLTTHRRLAFLVPANVDSLEITVSSFPHQDGVFPPDGTAHDVAFELHHIPGTPNQAEVLAVPAGRTPDIVVDAQRFGTFPATVRESITLSGAQLKPGRWFVVPISKLGNPLNFNVTLKYPQVRPMRAAAGHYFNPERPGHGFYLGEAGDQWVLIWYTYTASGLPVWYYAQGWKPSDASGGSQWNATLYRNVWAGGRTCFQFVGWVQLAVTGDGRMEFAHLVQGTLGLETLQRLGAPGCSQRWADQPLDVKGLWYAPEKSGYGFSAEMVGGSEFFLAYAYDELGLPRWATAQQSFNAANEAPLLQARGFCLTCPVAPVTREAIGQLDRTLSAAAAPDGRPGFGVIGIDARWAQGIVGGWSERRPAALLSARTSCQ